MRPKTWVSTSDIVVIKDGIAHRRKDSHRTFDKLVEMESLKKEAFQDRSEKEREGEMNFKNCWIEGGERDWNEK